MSTAHPARKMVESLHAKGAIVRLQVDVQHEDVVIPDFVREKWPEQLVIDLDPSWPLNLEFTDAAIEADLSFGGYVERCVFPLAAILMVADRETGKGIRLPGSLPDDQQREREVEQAARRVAARDSDRPDAGGSRRRRRRKPKAETEAEAPAGPAPVAVEPVDTSEISEPAEVAQDGSGSETTEERAQRRRAVFRVIDGDG